MRKTVLILQAERTLREALVESLAPARHELRVVAVGDTDSAYELVEQAGVDLVVVDLAAERLDGFVVAGRVLRGFAEVPVLALTREGAPQLSSELEEQHLRGLRKPVDGDTFREHVLALLAHAPRGHLTGISAGGLLQLMRLEQRSGVLLIETPDGRGRLVILDGELVDAEALGARGDEAVLRIGDALSMPESEIVLEELVGPVERTISRSIDGLLLEAARRRDELLHARRGGAPLRTAR